MSGLSDILIQLAIGVVPLGIAYLAFRAATEAKFKATLEKAAEDPAQALRDQIASVDKAFTEATRLMDNLRREFEAQEAARDALIAQAQEQQRLLEVNEEQAEKIRQILVGETKATIRAERHQQWMFFALGVVVSIPIGIMINLFVP
ncbi:hypothetical protein ACWDRB_32275 [Nonomuraea sp. NPDC003707]